MIIKLIFISILNIPFSLESLVVTQSGKEEKFSLNNLKILKDKFYSNQIFAGKKMAKRNANTELNHDNWNEEEEPQEAGVFVQADNKTMEGRVIKKAKRRGIKNVRI